MDKVKSGEQFAPIVVVPKRGSHIRECCDCQVTINQHLEINCKTTAEFVKLLRYNYIKLREETIFL